MTLEENYLVAFLDIIGFKSLITDFIESGDESIKEKLEDGLKNAELNSKKHQMDAEETDYDSNIQLKQFSDCTSISFKHPSIEEIEKESDRFGHELATSLLVLRDFQHELLESNILIRGGLSLGRVHYENDNMIFSEGLVNSHFLESKVAFYPRIILHENLFGILKTMFEHHKEPMSRLGVDKILICDFKGIIFINPFNSFEVFEYEILRILEKKYGFLPESKKDEIIAESKKKDEEFQSNVWDNIEKEILRLEAEAEIDCNTLKKLYWFKDFIEWNQRKKPSKFGFEYLRYKHLK